MGTKSTHLITRPLAVGIITDRIEKLDNGQLAALLDTVVNSYRHNFVVVDDVRDLIELTKHPLHSPAAIYTLSDLEPYFDSDK